MSSLSTVHHPAPARGHPFARAALLVAVALLVTLLVAPTAHAAGLGQSLDPSTFADSAISFLKKLWVYVIIAEIIAALTYVTAFFTQSWFPSFFQAFQGEWVKKAVIISVAAHPVLAALYAAAESAKGGFQ